MANYYNLYSGAAKSRMHLIMTDDLRKVENYKDELVKSSSGSITKYRFFKIELAMKNAPQFKQNCKGAWDGQPYGPCGHVSVKKGKKN